MTPPQWLTAVREGASAKTMPPQCSGMGSTGVWSLAPLANTEVPALAPMLIPPSSLGRRR